MNRPVEPARAAPSSRPATRWLAAGLLAVTITLALASLVLIVAVLRAGGSPQANDEQAFGQLSLGASYAAVGWLVAWRRSANPLGWVYLAIGLSQVGSVFLEVASYYGLVVAPGSIPGADVLTWIGAWAWDPGFSLLVSFSLLLFPDGRLPSPRWRPVAWLAIVAMVLLGIPTAVVSWPIRGLGLIGTSTPVPDIVNLSQSVGFLILVGVALASIASIVARFRRSRGRERQQLKWFTVAVIPEILFVLGSGYVTYPPGVWVLGALFISPLLPIAIGVAILRYRLYEIDRIISRTIAYAVVVAILGTAFAGSILVLEAALASFTQGQTVAVAASTLAVFALFQPVLRRVRRAVDRRFDRARYDADRTVAAFAGRLRDEVDLETIRGDLARTTQASLRPGGIGIWIHEREGGR